MKTPKEKKKRHIIWYVLYSILLIMGFLYYLFPEDAFIDYLKATADKRNAEYLHFIQHMELGFPPGVTLQGLRLARKSEPERSLFKARRLTVRPAMRSLVDGRPKICFDSRAYKGELDGCIRFGNRRFQSPVNVSVQLKDLRLEDYAYMEDMIGRRVSGLLGGVLEYSGNPKAWMRGEGEGDLRIANGRVELVQPLFIFESIDFEEVTARFVLKNQRINLTQMQLNSPDIKGSLSGSIVLKNKLARSILSLKGTIEPYAGLFKGNKGGAGALQFFKNRLRQGKLTFTVRGTLEEPRFKLI